MKTIDATDKKILTELQRDGRQSIAELADKVNLSQSPCWRRVRQLEQQGVVQSYGARLDRNRMGFGVTGFVHLQLEGHSPEITNAFEREVVALQQVVACHNLSGKYDYMLEVIAADLEEFSNLLRNQIRSIPGVKEISTSFSLKEVKRTDVVPVL
ncbi:MULTISPECIES: Lrp/AsnC family transcriptional regulator [Undibacterium]|uniref:Lrp/AsnC family transcriptional regulator n=1 Tax=Undibacterium luofuense TaxID=2828733 RepID=A0A941DMV3_9BURK|nr:Lrp/AsnC family transcriptional regulator [Undibacterium luofuense]MBR7783723.1 Lrp/AsnC family transcriptional regulator [Undibacterium luofuense]